MLDAVNIRFSLSYSHQKRLDNFHSHARTHQTTFDAILTNLTLLTLAIPLYFSDPFTQTQTLFHPIFKNRKTEVTHGKVLDGFRDRFGMRSEKES